MRFKRFHKIALLPVFVALLIGCNSCNKVVRECQQEYDQLSTTEFQSLLEADTAIGLFLSKYEGKKKCLEYYSKAEQMRQDFSTMRNEFFNIDNNIAPKDRYCAFFSLVNSHNDTFSNSDFEAVRNTWNYLVNDKKVTYMRDRLNAIDYNEFVPHLKKYVLKEVSRWYPKFKVVDSYVLNEQMEEMSVVEEGDKLAMKGVCIVHLELLGNRMPWAGDWIPRKTGFLEVWAEGTMRISDDSNCNVSFSRGHLEIYEDGMPEKPNIQVEFHVF